MDIKTIPVCQLSFLIILLSCNSSNSNERDSIIRKQKSTIDSLSAMLEKGQQEDKETTYGNDQQTTGEYQLSKKRKFVIAKITCTISVPEYTKVYDEEEPTFEGPLPEVNTLKSGDKLREERSHNEIFYSAKPFTYYSEIKEITDFNEDKKYLFLDEIVGDLKRKNNYLQKIKKRECLTFNSYSEASQQLERLTEN